MVKLRRDLVKLLTLCKLMKNREDAKSEILDSDFKMIEARLQAEDYKNEVFKKLEYQKNKEQKRILEQQRQVIARTKVGNSEFFFNKTHIKFT